MRNPWCPGSCCSVARISAASAGVTRSSASSESIQSWLASEAAKFFCAGYPGHSRTTTRSVYRRAIATVSSVLSESTTMSSSAQDTDDSASPISAASFFVITVTETFGTAEV